MIMHLLMGQTKVIIHPNLILILEPHGETIFISRDRSLVYGQLPISYSQVVWTKKKKNCKNVLEEIQVYLYK